jgi:catechol 2,3-dioxygenase-like lactoylglutathione lyase family enzyme
MGNNQMGGLPYSTFWRSTNSRCIKKDLPIEPPENGTLMSLGDIRNLDYTVLLCTKLQETKAFYRDVMGFTLVRDGERWVEFQVGAAVLALKLRGPGLAWDDGPLPAGSAALQLAFRVAPRLLDGCYDTLKAKGVEILSPPRDITAYHHRALFFRDPEGNVVELYAEV